MMTVSAGLDRRVQSQTLDEVCGRLNERKYTSTSRLWFEHPGRRVLQMKSQVTVEVVGYEKEGDATEPPNFSWRSFEEEGEEDSKVTVSAGLDRRAQSQTLDEAHGRLNKSRYTGNLRIWLDDPSRRAFDGEPSWLCYKQGASSTEGGPT